jgi:hypothetical protein
MAVIPAVLAIVMAAVRVQAAAVRGDGVAGHKQCAPQQDAWRRQHRTPPASSVTERTVSPCVPVGSLRRSTGTPESAKNEARSLEGRTASPGRRAPGPSARTQHPDRRIRGPDREARCLNAKAPEPQAKAGKSFRNDF